MRSFFSCSTGLKYYNRVLCVHKVLYENENRYKSQTTPKTNKNVSIDNMKCPFFKDGNAKGLFIEKNLDEQSIGNDFIDLSRSSKFKFCCLNQANIDAMYLLFLLFL